MKCNENSGFRRKSSCSIDQLRQAEMQAVSISKIPPFCTFRGVPPVRDTMQKKATILRKLRQLENGRKRELALASKRQVKAQVEAKANELKESEQSSQVVGWELALGDVSKMIEMHAF